jgi:thioester reductase-like protein
MKIILTGATGVLGSHIMYEILELLSIIKLTENFLLSQNKGKNSALNRINELLSSSYTPKVIKDKGLENYINILESLTTDLASIEILFKPDKGCLFLFILQDT